MQSMSERRSAERRSERRSPFPERWTERTEIFWIERWIERKAKILLNANWTQRSGLAFRISVQYTQLLG